MSDYHIYWGEAHDNTYQFPEQNASFEEVCRRAATHLDFYAAAYYTSCADAFRTGGHPAEGKRGPDLILEHWKSPERLRREWDEVQQVCAAQNAPGRFVTFPGYEWQGDGSGGDHNIFFRREGHPVFRVDALAELYDRLRGIQAVAIPHHTAYRPGRRGRDWSVFDERISPWCEICSIHGCSETDEERIGLRQNPHMGPGMSAGTYRTALRMGLHLGAACSTDNWGDMPGHYGHGLMACLAPELTRDSLWEAFMARRVYGVTGDRIELDFTVNGTPMGSILPPAGERRIRVQVRGSDAIDRIELLRNERVIATHCHQGTWEAPSSGSPAKWKLRVEAGWGPAADEIALPPRRWRGELTVEGGQMLGVEPSWISPGQGQPVVRGNTVRFEMVSSGDTVGGRHQNAEVFEFTAEPLAELRLRLNGCERRGKVAEFARRSDVIWYRDECVQMLAEHADLPPGSPERGDVYHHMAYKAKVHRAMPERAYTAGLAVEDAEPFEREVYYRVRVEQRNGGRAWSSPIWVEPPAQGA